MPLRNDLNDALTCLHFLNFKCCESFVLYIILLEVARELSRFRKMARRSNVFGPHCLMQWVFTPLCTFQMIKIVLNTLQLRNVIWKSVLREEIVTMRKNVLMVWDKVVRSSEYIGMVIENFGDLRKKLYVYIKCSGSSWKKTLYFFEVTKIKVSILFESLKCSSFIVFTVTRRSYLLKYCSVGEPGHWKSTRFIQGIIFTGGFVMCAFAIFVEQCSFRGT